MNELKYKSNSHRSRDADVTSEKKVVSDIVSDGVHMMLYGENGRGKKTTRLDYRIRTITDARRGEGL